jgi:two-component system CitB family sensor kinase
LRGRKDGSVFIHDWSIARRLFVAQALFMLVLTVMVTTALFVDSRDRYYLQAQERMLSVSTAIAVNPLVLQAATSADPTAVLEPYAERVMAGADIDFITIMAPDRTRWTHPNPAEIGKPYIGSVDQALGGSPYTEITAGTLGPSVRAIVPVRDGNGTVRALVASGVTVTNVEVAVGGRLPAVVGIAVALLLGGALASWLLGRYLRRVTLGWGPERLGQLFAYYESVLHSVGDGLVLADTAGNLLMYNDRAAELLGIEAPVEGRPPRPLTDLGLPAGVRELLGTGRAARDEVHLVGERLLVVSQEPARSPGGMGRRPKAARMGTVMTLQDHTDLLALGDELRSTRTLTDALRAQTHEHANRIHTLVSLLELGRTEQALQFATEDLELSQRLADEVINSVDEPVLSALLMGKVAQAHERGVELRVEVHSEPDLRGIPAHDLVTILGNLIDNALDAAADGDDSRWVEVEIGEDQGNLLLEVADSGSGVSPDQSADVFRKGFSTKLSDGGGRGIGLALVRQSVLRMGGTLTIGRGKGAVFTVRLPAARAAVPVSPAPEGEADGTP